MWCFRAGRLARCCGVTCAGSFVFVCFSLAGRHRTVAFWWLVWLDKTAALVWYPLLVVVVGNWPRLGKRLDFARCFGVLDGRQLATATAQRHARRHCATVTGKGRLAPSFAWLEVVFLLARLCPDPAQLLLLLLLRVFGRVLGPKSWRSVVVL